ncbi:O-antigen ligase family protein [Shewanella algae]|uniref:O-antigen ligase family protein n=1 Tax=Shewanella algae TaxID=38313 RepID=UPI001AADCB2A|nr:O-antigen ligase family protein [Shewanella algae]MBO2687293.1 O-antigen ligase family protein [Shewanella algae]MDC8852142.1 O-antigen ligase family protein [Shewanella algae]
MEFLIAIIISLSIIRETVFVELFGTTFLNLLILAFLFLVTINSRLNKFFYIALFLVVVNLISININVNTQHPGGIITFFIYSFTLILLAVKKNSIDFILLNKLLGLVSCLFIFIVYYYYFSGLQQFNQFFILTGPFLNQNTTAMSSLALLTLNVVTNRNKNLISSSLVFFLFIVIVMTQSRASLLAATIIITFYFWSLYRWWVIVIYGILMTFIFSYLLANPDLFSHIMARLFESGTSGRTELWFKAYNILTEDIGSFMFGVGVNNLILSYGASEDISVHNSYINHIANYGFLSTLILVLFIFSLLLSNLVRYRQVNIFVVSSFSLLLTGMFETILFSGFNPIWITLIFIIYLSNILETKHAYTNIAI